MTGVWEVFWKGWLEATVSLSLSLEKHQTMKIPDLREELTQEPGAVASAYAKGERACWEVIIGR